MERHLTASQARQRFLRLIDEAIAGDQIGTLKAIARLWQDPEALRAMREATADLAKGRLVRTRRVPGVHQLLRAARAQGLLRG